MSGTYNATIRRVVISAWIGNSIEYYDFLLYGLASALVFSPPFFPRRQPVYRHVIFFCQFRRRIYFPAAGRTIFWQQGRYAWT
ncbi:transporter [Salmonella enterica subsp. arizonae]|uniref:Transporter n=1 Tax=Salmonella enterica subsp. arizonae TaxID=59203 RepID=A0A379S928_SALER|nr:transporter [Salmonella enterica subsp. arizonae]